MEKHRFRRADTRVFPLHASGPAQMYGSSSGYVGNRVPIGLFTNRRRPPFNLYASRGSNRISAMEEYEVLVVDRRADTNCESAKCRTMCARGRRRNNNWKAP